MFLIYVQGVSPDVFVLSVQGASPDVSVLSAVQTGQVQRQGGWEKEMFSSGHNGQDLSCYLNRLICEWGDLDFIRQAICDSF